MNTKNSDLDNQRANLAATLMFLGLVVFFYREVIFGNSIFVFVDASRFFYPLWKWGGEILKGGFIPLWNPDAQFGTPYLADPQMAYAYPPVPILYLFLSPLNAFAALIILHHFWALLGFWCFARGQGFSAKASFLGSLAFGFSLHVVCSSWTPVALLTISWVPWVFWALEKVLRGEKGGFFYLSFVWAMQLAAGYPVLVYLTALAVGLQLAWRVIAKTPLPPFAQGGIGTIALAGLTAVVYNLVWGLPFAELLGESNYHGGAEKFQDLGFWDLATLLAPFVQGHPLLPNYHGPHYWVGTYFMGMPALCLLLWGLVRRLGRVELWGFWACLLVLSLGAGKWLRLFFPGYNLVVHSGFWISLFLFVSAWLATLFADQFLAAGERFRRDGVWLSALVLFFGTAYLLQEPLPEWCFWAALLASATPFFLRESAWRWACLVLATVLSLGSAAVGLNILMDRGYYTAPPRVLARLDKPGRFFFSPYLLKEAVRLQGETMETAYLTAKEKLYPDWPLAFGREEAPWYNTLQLRRTFSWTWDSLQVSAQYTRRTLDFLGVRYFFGKSVFKDFRKASSSSDDGEVFENPTPFPKWFTVERSLAAGKSLEDEFTLAGRTSMDYRKECFAEKGPGGEKYQRREVQVFSAGPNQLRLEAKGDGKALVISSETAYPGWKATVQNQGRPLELINHAFRGIVLGPEEQEAKLFFAPLTFRLGLFVSLMVGSLWMVLLLGRLKP